MASLTSAGSSAALTPSSSGSPASSSRRWYSTSTSSELIDSLIALSFFCNIVFLSSSCSCRMYSSSLCSATNCTSNAASTFLYISSSLLRASKISGHADSVPISCATSSYPSSLALASAVRPSLSLTVQSAPYRVRSRSTVPIHPYLAAFINAVRPSLSTASTSAPRFINRSTVVPCPPDAAPINAVSPRSPGVSIFAPLSSRILQISGNPANAAAVSAVMPRVFGLSTRAPYLLMRILTSVVCPPIAADVSGVHCTSNFGTLKNSFTST